MGLAKQHLVFCDIITQHTVMKSYCEWQQRECTKLQQSMLEPKKLMHTIPWHGWISFTRAEECG